MTHEVDLFMEKFLNVREKAEKRIIYRLAPYVRRKVEVIRERKRKELEEQLRKQREVDEKQKLGVSQKQVTFGGTFRHSVGRNVSFNIF